MSETVILSSVYQPYRWMAPVLAEQIERLWPGHPPIVFAGLTMEESGGLPAIPVRDPALPRDWCAFMRDACEELRNRGVKRCFLIPEEHPPLAPCHAQHLNETLPRLMDELGASYITLMGWDHPRSVHRGSPLVPDRHGLHRLDDEFAPRFQLHPALWQLDALIACLDLILALPNHSPWSFENNVRKATAALPEEMKRGTFGVCGAAMSLRPPSPLAKASRAIGHFISRRLIGFSSWLPKPLLQPYWRAMRFDHFYFNGPYPMFFGGVMTKGRINEFYWRHITRDAACREACGPLIEGIRQNLLA